MSAISIAASVTTTLVLRSEQRRNLLYIVEIETKEQTFQTFTSENYYQALTVAQRVFNRLMTKKDQIGDFGVMIEGNQGRGASYDVSRFTFTGFDDTDSYYKELCNDFEHVKFKSRNKNNLAFRKVVRQHGLNEYQEQKFLGYLKRLGCLS